MNILVNTPKPNKTVQAYAIDQALNELTSSKTLEAYVATLDNLDAEIEKVREYVERTKTSKDDVSAELCAAAIKAGTRSMILIPLFPHVLISPFKAFAASWT